VAKLTQDYTGRLSDLDLFGADDDPMIRPVSLSLSPGSMVGGKYKEAQKFLRILLSDKNTSNYDGYGTDLLTQLNRGLISNAAQFRVLFASAKADVINFLKTAKIKSNGELDTRFQDDEYIVNVLIQKLDVHLDSITLVLNFVYLDDDGDVLIPVRIPVG
tara:strand:- start:480 stop:959 length:480 start_codon:yes stop_codon:yes gene_type:complete